MKNNVNKWVSLSFVLVIALAMVFVMPIQADATTLDGLSYEITDGEVTITACDTAVTGDLVIPDTIEGCPVTVIGDRAFNRCSSMTGITIPDGVTSIGDRSFYSCTSLTSVSFPDSITSIGQSAFYNCKNLSRVNITNITAWCVLNFPDSGSNPLFYGAGLYLNGEAVTKLVIPDGVTSIGKLAFCRCTSLTQIVIPDSVTSIGMAAFNYCTNLTDVSVGNSVAAISVNAFSNCTSLVRINISDSVISVEGSAFENCTSLTEIVIPDSITTIGSYAFADCSSLTLVTGGNSITEIGEFAFKDCSSLNSITVPGSVTNIGRCAFRGCTGLTGIWVDEDNANYSSDENGVLFNKDKSHLIQAPGKYAGIYVVPDSVTTIADYAFYGSSTIGVFISDSVITIGGYIFYDCDSLICASIGGGVTSIGSSAFNNCDNLSHVTFAGTQSQLQELIAVYDSNTEWTEVTCFHYEAELQIQETCTHTGAYCPVCVAAVTSAEKAVAAHSYGQWTVIKENSYTEAGEKTRTCGTCGDVQTEQIPVLSNPVDEWNVMLKDRIGVNFNLTVEASDTVTASINGKTVNISRTDNGDGSYRIYLELAAAQMNDQVQLSVNGEPTAKQYSVRSYAQEILSGDYDEDTKAMVNYMLDYGAAAQSYFSYNTEAPANEGLTDISAVDIPDNQDSHAGFNGGIDGVACYAMSLVHQDRIAVRFYFTGDVSGCYFTANDKTYTPVAKDGMYYIEVADILPQNLDQQITLTATDAEGNTLSVTYGPMNYIVRMNKKGSDALKLLVKALYNYHLAAKAFAAAA